MVYGERIVDEICKTIIVKDEQDNFHALFLLGSDRIDFGKVRKAIGKVRNKLRFRRPSVRHRDED